MKKLSLFSFVLVALCCIFSSCNKIELPEAEENGSIVFNFNSALSGLNKSSINTQQDSIAESALRAIVISIVDSKGNSVVSTEEIPLYNMNGNYISKPISLKKGNYKLTDFLVIDAVGKVIYLSPKEGSPKAYLVNDPLPIEFNITKDQVNKVSVEVLRNLGEDSMEFGYTTFTFDVVKVFDFLVSVFTADDSSQNFMLTNAEIIVNKNDNNVYEGLLLPKTNKITLRDDYGIYNLLIRKNGYKDYILDLTLAELKGYSNNPLVVVLTKAIYKLPDGLIAFYPFNGNANDISENHLNGFSFASLTNDRFGNSNSAYHFNGSNQYIDFPNDSLLKPQFPFTLACWVKLEQYDPSNFMVVNDFALDIYAGACLQVTATGYAGMTYGNGGYISVYSRYGKRGNTILNLNQWYHITGVFVSATQLELYVNGVNDGGVYAGEATHMEYSKVPGTIGRKDCGNYTFPPYYLKGYVDDVAFYNRVLNPNDVTALYNYR